jgi:uncharacterized protein
MGSRTLVEFGRLLRARGLPVGTGRILTFCRGVAAVRPPTRSQLYWTGKSTLVSRPEDFGIYDEAFEEFFADEDINEVLDKLFEFLEKVRAPDEVESGESAEVLPAEQGGEAPGDDIVPVLASSVELLRTKPFDELSEEERVEVYRALRSIRLDLPERIVRRRRSSHVGTMDLRRTLRKSLRTQGEPFHRAWKMRRHTPRPLVLILDVSGSMSAYSRALLQFGFAAMNAGRKVEVFCFGTRLTRVTRPLRAKDPDRALSEASALTLDWSGGTRIGDSLKTLLDGYSSSTALRGAIAVLCSDGLERGDPDFLAQQMYRLHRLVHKVVWVNPLAGDIRYEPLARGMAVALPYIDIFLPGHNLASVESLAKVLAG